MTRGLSRAEVADLCGCQPRDLPSNPSFSLTRFFPPGPVCAAYINSSGPIDVIMGPGGSGKTIGSFFKIVKFAVGSMPACKDGVVRVRGTVLRDNYRSLYRTTLRSWFAFFPPDFPGSTFLGGADRPAQHRLKLATVRDGREVPVDLEIDFFAVGDIAIEELLKSYETTIGYCNEADQLHERVIPFLYSRTGRYPSLEDLPPGSIRPRVVCADMNPPKPNHPLLKAAQRGTFKKPDPGAGKAAPAFDPNIPAEAPIDASLEAARAINFFQQPSGLSKEAENRRGKTFAEYQQDLVVMSEEDGRRMVHGLPGYAHDGKPVYVREFSRKKHIAAGPLTVLQGVPLHIGFDQGGLRPAALGFQISSLGQVRIVREVWLGHGIGYQRFVEGMRALLTQPLFADLPPGHYTCDPAGFYGADKVQGQLSWAQCVSEGLGRAIYPAWTNEPGARWEVVRQKLLKDIDATTPGLIIDPSCEMLIEGFEAEYKHPKFREGAPKDFGDGVVDNDFTNPQDALQYGLLGVYQRDQVLGEAARAGRGGNVVPLHGRSREGVSRPGDFNVFDI